MRTSALVVVVAAVGSIAFAAPRSDLAVLGIRAPSRVRLTDVHAKASARATVRLANRGAATIDIPDAATLGSLVRLSARPVDGPIACPPLGIALDRAHLRFPLTLPPGRDRAVRYRLDFTC